MNPEDFLSLLIRRGLPLDLPDLVPQIDGLGLQPADSLRQLPMFRQSADRDRDLRLTGADRCWPEVYMTAEAKALTGSDIDREIEVFSRRSVAQGGPGWTADDVRGYAPIRLYRAPALSHSMLAKDGKPDHRIMVDIRGRHSSR